MKQSKKITRFDVWAMVIVTLLYAVLSFVNLGDMAAPKTKTQPQEDKVKIDVVLTAEKSTNVNRLMYFEGLGKGKFEIFRSSNGGTWTKICESETGSCFTWQSISIGKKAKYFRVRAEGDKNLEIYELALIGADDEVIRVSASAHPELFDEQEMVPPYATYKNGTYFDEIYHARTAYENAENIYPYEISHPPLGKLIISVGVRIFGMNPFGWRVMGNLFGIMMLPLMYLFAKRIFKNSFAALAAMLLLTFDFMHFVQTRIATIDSFSVFFIMLMYYLMYIYFESSVEKLPYKKSLSLLCVCGIVFGLGIATKWICAYAGAGLAILYAIATVRRAKEGAPWLKTCLWCVLFFVIVPFIIYFVSYTPYFVADSTRGAFEIFWNNQKYMLSYHSKLEATHPFQCAWYTWPAIVRPIWFYGGKECLESGMASSIVSMGNPALWWLGTASALWLILKPKKKNFEWFILIGYLSQYLPWVFVGRIVFIYHYFASVPFITLALVSVLELLRQKVKHGFAVSIGVLAVACVLFVMFYPILSGMQVSVDYVQNFLKWFPSWVLCYS